MAKRARSINWEREEKQLLREIIKPFLNIVENKDITTNTNRAKANAWIEITDKFNRANKRPRNKKQLMNQWKITKIKWKKEASQNRQGKFKTRGGPKPSTSSPETIGPLPQVFEIYFNELDCDGQKRSTTPNEDTENIKECQPKKENLYLHTDVKPCTHAKHHVRSESVISNPELSTSSEGSFCTDQLASESPKHSTKKRRIPEKTYNFSKASLKDMHKYRELENKRQQQEHELRMISLTELHNQMMKNLKLQEDILSDILKKNRTI